MDISDPDNFDSILVGFTRARPHLPARVRNGFVRAEDTGLPPFRGLDVAQCPFRIFPSQEGRWGRVSRPNRPVPLAPARLVCAIGFVSGRSKHLRHSSSLRCEDRCGAGDSRV